MSYLIDTDCLSLLRRAGKSRKLEAFVRANEAEMFVSIVSWAEIAHGVMAAADPRFRTDLETWLGDLRHRFSGATEPLDEPVLIRWQRLLSDLKANNRTMTCEDSLIAATALHHSHTIATRNLSHFKPSGVSAIDPTA
jgi:predicted nucleic acid-binding protein